MTNHVKNEIQLTGIKAVVFDVFGTLVEIGEKRRPYVQLLKLLHAAGRPLMADDGIQIMSHNVGLAGAIQMFGWELPAASIASLELDLYAELPTIKLYSEVLGTLMSLRAGGFKIGVCSNLAAPYAVPVKTLLPFERTYQKFCVRCRVAKLMDSVCKAFAEHDGELIGGLFPGPLWHLPIFLNIAQGQEQ